MTASMRERNGDGNIAMLPSVLARATGFFVVWVAIAGMGRIDLAVGALAAIVATVASLHLLPPGQWRLHPVAIGRLVVHFLLQSVIAGVDVAWRALHPRLPLQPGFILYRPHIQPGPAQSCFFAMASLLPGTLPCGVDGNEAIVVHCLDTRQPVVEQLGDDEARFARVVGGASRHE